MGPVREPRWQTTWARRTDLRGIREGRRAVDPRQVDDDVSWEEGIRDDRNLAYFRAGRGKAHVAQFLRRSPSNARAHPVRATRDLRRWRHDRRAGHARRADHRWRRDRHDARECHVWRFGGDGKVAAFNHVLDLAVHERAYAQRTDRRQPTRRQLGQQFSSVVSQVPGSLRQRALARRRSRSLTGVGTPCSRPSRHTSPLR